EDTWKRVVPEYPLQARFLSDWFQDGYKLYDLSAKTLTGFAVFSLILALIGLFGLSAFMAEQRTKEIGIRKVQGATNKQILKFLVWQFSKPVLLAIPFALALAYLASNIYLEFFSERIDLPYGMLLLAGFCGLLLAWVTVAIHALKVASTNPINALHCE
ncbi:MAG: FtsX-like permease family protein, partial [Emcibacteraceae bacterium]|nr:FtsX-like permease family protein [Emcibacteraceae bacterium]